MNLSVVYKVLKRYILILLLKMMAILLSYRQNKPDVTTLMKL